MTGHCKPCVYSANIYIYIYTGWWFGAFFIFHDIWDNPSHWLSCFSRLLKAPTSSTILFFMAKEEETRGTKEETVFRKPEAHLDMVENGGHRCPPRPFWSYEIRHADPSAVEMTGWHCWTRLCRNVGTSKIDVKRSQDRPFLRYETMKHHQIRKANNDRNSSGVDLCTWGWGFWSQRSKGAQLGLPDVPDFLTKKIMSLYFVFISSAQHRGPRIIGLFPDDIRWSVNGPFGKCCWSMSKRVWSHYFRFIGLSHKVHKE